MGGHATLLRAGAVLWAASVVGCYAGGLLGPLSFFYLLCGAAAVASTWREGEDLRRVGLVLLGAWTISNAWCLAWGSEPHEIKATVYTVLEVSVAITALIVTMHRLCWTMVAIVSAAAFSTSANVIFAATPYPVWSQSHLHELVTNICFALECGFAVWAGRRNCSERAGGAGKFSRPRLYWRNTQRHGAAGSTQAEAGE